MPPEAKEMRHHKFDRQFSGGGYLKNQWKNVFVCHSDGSAALLQGMNKGNSVLLRR